MSTILLNDLNKSSWNISIIYFIVSLAANSLVLLLYLFVGEPGRVHISAATYKFLADDYEIESGKTVEGKLRT